VVRERKKALSLKEGKDNRRPASMHIKTAAIIPTGTGRPSLVAEVRSPVV
jgi:hypothetical protein